MTISLGSEILTENVTFMCRFGETIIVEATNNENNLSCIAPIFNESNMVFFHDEMQTNATAVIKVEVSTNQID